MTGSPSRVSTVDVGAFLERGARSAGALTLLSDAGGSYSGNDLAGLSAAIASALTALNVEAGEPVLLAPAGGIQRMLCYWALLRLGAIPVVVDNPEQIGTAAAAAGCSVAIGQADQRAAFTGAGIERGLALAGTINGWLGYDAACEHTPLQESHAAADADLCALVPLPKGSAIALARRTHRAVAITGGVAALYHGAQPDQRLLVAGPLDNWLLESLLFCVLCGNARAHLLDTPDPDVLAGAILDQRPTAVIAPLDLSLATAPPEPSEETFGPLLWNITIDLATATRNNDIRAWRRDLPTGWLGQALCGDAALGGIAAWYEPEGRWHPLPTVGIDIGRGPAGELRLRSPQLPAGFLDPRDTERFCAGGWCAAGVSVTTDDAGFLVTGTGDQAASPAAAAVDPAQLTAMTGIDIGAFMDRGAACHGARPMLQVDQDHFSAAEVTRRAHCLSGGLQRQHRVRRGDRVAVLLHNGNEFLEVYWACARLGAVVVPVNFRLQPAEISYILNDSGARLLIAEPEHRGWHADLRAASPNLEAILTTGANDDGGGAGDYEALIAAQEPLSGEAIDGIARDTDPCSILYTAGTTGFPKGAVRTHKAVLWYILNAGAMSSPGDRGEAYLAVPPMFHIAGHETRLPMTVMRGSRMVILTAFNPGEVLDFIEQERVTAMFVPPTMGHVMLQTMAEGRWDLSSWREWISASAPLPAPVRDRALELLPHLQFSNSLGMTEAGVLASAGGDILARKVSTCVGRAAPTVALAILDPSGQPQPTGESGEICIRSPQVIEAYWHNPEATANATEGGWFHTGDVGVLDHERHLTVLDRIKDMIITGGENVYAPEVESQLLAFPEIADAAVFGLPDEKWGEIVVAALVQKPQAELTGREVIERCRERIAHYKCPSRVLFVDALPRNAMGKVMKQQLRDGYQGATP